MLCFALMLVCLLATTTSAADAPPAVGDTAPDFTLNSIEGKPYSLRSPAAKGPTVLVVLRGWPGYQCPICTAQVAGLLAKSDELAGSNVVLVYPGPAAGLSAKAKEFLGKKTLPANFHFLVDPDYRFTNQYQLRWDAKNETAYPSTFVIDPAGKVRFAKISKSHGGRASTAEILKAVGEARSR